MANGEAWDCQGGGGIRSQMVGVGCGRSEAEVAGSCSGGTNGLSDGVSGLDLLRDKDGNFDESSRYRGSTYKAGVRSGDGGTGLI
nr:hypothetical protein [Tanacetum cinerariifolium]